VVHGTSPAHAVASAQQWVCTHEAQSLVPHGSPQALVLFGGLSWTPTICRHEKVPTSAIPTAALAMRPAASAR
jgi:hypothetical protein